MLHTTGSPLKYMGWRQWALSGLWPTLTQTHSHGTLLLFWNSEYTLMLAPILQPDPSEPPSVNTALRPEPCPSLQQLWMMLTPPTFSEHNADQTWGQTQKWSWGTSVMSLATQKTCHPCALVNTFLFWMSSFPTSFTFCGFLFLPSSLPTLRLYIQCCG
jgi:hypothetical protein